MARNAIFHFEPDNLIEIDLSISGSAHICHNIGLM